MRQVLLLFLLLSQLSANAQMDWWNQIHNWDGATPWTQYMNYSHAYLGPNAIPIPTLQRSNMGSYFKSSSQMSLIEDDSFLTLHNELHWDRGHTQIHITHQSIEYYRMSEEVRDLRISRDQDGEGVSGMSPSFGLAGPGSFTGKTPIFHYVTCSLQRI